MNSSWRLYGVLALVLAVPMDAYACGGCFAPPPPTPDRAQVVTDHRMVLSLSQRQTTLWDQIQYSGNPEDFVWVLPVANAATLRMGLADNNFVNALDEYSAPYVTADPPACFGGFVTPRDAGRGFLIGCGDSSGGAPSWTPGAGSESTRVMRDGESVVGPYAITVVGSKTGNGLIHTWLTDHGYAIPGATRSVIDYYSDLQFDFIVMRLRPGAGVHQMQPIRVTTRGYSPVLPLRMIAAGIADKVGLTLMVVADSRVEAHGFTNAEIRREDLEFDYVAGRSNWRQVFSAAVAQNRGRTWITESAQGILESQMAYEVGTLADAGADVRLVPGFDAETPMDVLLGDDDALPVMDVGAAIDGFGDVFLTDDVPNVPADVLDAGDAPPPLERYIDRRYLFTELRGRGVITRLRTELGAVNLDGDLLLDASDGGTLGVEYLAGRVVNAPTCPPQPQGFLCSAVGTSAPLAMEALFVVGVVLRIRRRRAAQREE